MKKCTPKPSPAGRAGFTMIEMMIVLAVIAIVALIAIPNLLASKTAANETAALANLKSVATAQNQFLKKFDHFAPSGTALGNLRLIPPDLPIAFHPFNDNGDPGSSPKSGYYFRMLQGDSGGDTCWVRTDTSGATAELSSFAVTARAAEPYGTGEFQFVLGEQGTVYKIAEPRQNTAGYKTFLLNALPPMPPVTWTTAK